MSDCVEAPGYRNPGGYVMVRPGPRGGTWLAHRQAWEEANGPVPDGLFVLHTCDNPPCVNLGHLWLGTKLDNARDRDAKGRHNPARGNRHGSRVHPDARPRGSANKMAKLSEGDIPGIRSRLDRGVTRRAIAIEFGVSDVAISKVALGQTWRHVQ